MKLSLLSLLPLLATTALASGENKPCKIVFECDEPEMDPLCTHANIKKVLIQACENQGGHSLYKNGQQDITAGPKHAIRRSWTICLCAHGDIEDHSNWHRWGGGLPSGYVDVSIGLGSTFGVCQATGGGDPPGPYDLY